MIAYHGTDAGTADRLVAGEPFADSDNEDDWFGKGVYFWEWAPKQAWWWARRKFPEPGRAAVVGAIIRLGNCFDLLDPQNVKHLKTAHREFLRTCTDTGAEVPRNVRARKNLDCAVFNFLYNREESAGRAVDSARAVYVPTHGRSRAWPGSWIYDEAHVQICVRNSKNILAVWHVQSDGRYGR